MKRDIKRLAGSAEGASLVAHAAVMQTPDQRWRVAIDLSGSARGHRTLTADTCLQLARASALIIALAANPDAALDLPTDEPSGIQVGARSGGGDAIPAASNTTTSTSSATPSGMREPKSVEPKSVEPKSVEPKSVEPKSVEPKSVEPVLEEPADRAQNTPSIRRHRWALFAHAGIEDGSLPTPTAWIGGGVRHRLRTLPLGFALSGFVTQATSARYDNGIGADFRVFAVHALACLQPPAEPWLVAVCFGPQFATTHAQGHFQAGQTRDPSIAGAEILTRNGWSAAPAAALMLGYEFIPSISLEIGAAAAIPPTRWEFVVDGIGPLYRAAGQQLMLSAGLAVLL